MSGGQEDRGIAIVGAACRLPGAEDLATYWRNLAAGEESIAHWSDEELAAAGVSEAARSHPRYIKAMGALDKIEWFDADFFGLGPREAQIMDPQQRIFLEICWHALEHAGCDPERFDGLVGVYAAAGMNTYAWNLLRPDDEILATLGSFRVTVANDKDFLATQVSYRCNLKGPSVGVQTACSSSLVATHLACQALESYDCDLALAGGVRVIAPQVQGAWYDDGGILSPEGRCRPFDAAAQGTVVASGAGVVVLKRLPEALEDGDSILAVIKGTAINNDGALKVGFTAPSQEGQAEVIAAAQSVAEVDPRTITYVEAHGTGTALGDPIEIAALNEVFRSRTDARAFCALGSVKSNFGHLDVAAGTAGLLKVALALHHRQIPATLHFERSNPRIALEESPFYVNNRLVEWPSTNGFPRRAAASSFGIGGTNAHVILEEAPHPSPTVPATAEGRWQLLPISARTASALERMGERLAEVLETAPDVDLANVAFTLQVGRKSFEYGRFVLCRTAAEGVEALRRESPLSTRRSPDPNRPVCFLFPGQGAQYAGMAQGLYEDEPFFRELIDQGAETLRGTLGLDLRELLFPPQGDIEGAQQQLAQTRYTQPALFLVSYATARLWGAWGIEPEGMLGHSVGEYVAATLAGVFTFDDALRLIAARGRLMAELPAGAMLSVGCSAAELSELLPDEVALAAVNGPARTVVSGTPEAIESVHEELTARSIEARPLRTSHAFHSPMMDPVVEAFGRLVAEVTLRPPERPFVSNLTGRWISDEEAVDPTYWQRQLRHTVRFVDGLATLLSAPEAVILEVGPGRTAATFCSQHPAAQDRRVLTSLPHPREERDDVAFLLATLGRLWMEGVKVNWRAVHGSPQPRRVVLPGYPFERRRFWHDTADTTVGVRGAATTEPGVSERASEDAGSASSSLASPGEASEGAPRGACEQAIADVWCEQIGVPSVKRHDNFFELGGDSLLATRVIGRLGEILGVALPVSTLFEAATLTELAARYEAAEASAVGHLQLPSLVPDPSDRFEPFPLNDLQQGYWVGRQQGFEMGNVATHLYQEVESSVLDPERLERVWQRLIERHDALRMVVLPNGQQQVLQHVEPYRVEVEDLRGRPAREVEETLAATRDRISHQYFAPDRWPLFEMRASRLDSGRVRLHVCVDGLILDGWSAQLLFAELAQLYLDEEAALPELEMTFRDYVLACLALRETEAYRLSQEYWQDKLADLPPAPQLPLAIEPRQLERPRFKRLEARFEAARWRRLKQRAGRGGLTANGLLMAAYAQILARWSSSPRFTLNVPRFNRLPLHPQVDALVGEFASFTLLEVDFASSHTFEQRAYRLQQRLWRDLDHALVNGIEMVRALRRLHRGDARAALMPVVFTTAPRGDGRDGVGSASALERLGERVGGVSETAQVWLDNQVQERSGDLVIHWDVVEELFPPGLLREMFAAYSHLLERLADDEAAWAEPAPERLTEERQRWLRRFGGQVAGAPQGLLHHRFAARAVAHPDRPAVITEGQTLTYGEVHRRARQLGYRLRQLGARPDDLVAAVIEKGWEQVVGVYATLFAGAAFLPLDPALPPRRRQALLARAETRWVLTQERLVDGHWPPGVECISVDTIDWDTLPDGELPDVATPDDLAYVLFTSGSTGEPKGAMLAHAGIVNALTATQERFPLGAEDRLIGLTALHHDMSIYDLFGSLAAGAAVVIPDPTERLDPAHWAELIDRHGVTVWNSVPAFMEMFLQYGAGREATSPTSLRRVFLGGDWIPLDIKPRLDALCEAVELVSVGGPTETSLWNIWYPVEAIDPSWKSVPYGHPIANARYCILGPDLTPRPLWVPGEMYCAGIGLAKGYWRDEERTRQAFIHHPQTGERLYRTGDLGRYLPDGAIEFLGRSDFQVQLRGIRIELGEIEAALRRQPPVRSAIVLMRQDTPGAPRLVAYVVADSRAEEGAEDRHQVLRQALRDELPEAMVPAAFVFLDELPLSANGKVDRSLLPAPEERRSAGVVAAPEGEHERAIAEVWCAALGTEEVSVEDNFFDLGGNSYLAIQVLGELRQRLGLEISIAQLFEHTSIRALARHLAERGDERPAAESGRARGASRRQALRQRRLPRRGPTFPEQERAT